MVVLDADGLFAVMFKNTFQDILLVPGHSVARGNHKAVINEGFHRYLNKVHKIHLPEKSSVHQWLQGVFFIMYSWNSVPVDGTGIYK